MGRVVRSRAASAQPGPSARASASSVTAHRKRKKNGYKVILESVTQEKKKLRLSASFREDPPPGYTFVPIGNAELTERCKEFCRKKGRTAYSVSAHPKNNATVDPEKISYHVNRIGFHFPSQIVDQAYNWLGLSNRRRRRPDLQHASRFAEGLSRRFREYDNYTEENKVRAAMQDLFPKIPKDSLEAIVEHAFAEGAKRVGNATNLTLERRVQMAVLAHVRHKHTDYDRLLKEVGYIPARKEVENPCIAKILEWRGEKNDDDIVEFEDDFREVIILDDDEDDEDQDSDDSSSGSEASMEFVSSQATAAELQPHYPGNGVHMHAPPRLRLTELRDPDPRQRLQLHGRPVPSSAPYFADAAHARPPQLPAVAHARSERPLPPAIDDGHYVRSVAPREAPRLSYVPEASGRFQSIDQPQNHGYRHPEERDRYGDVQRVRVARVAERDVRPRGDPTHGSEDVVMPSIEGDESARPSRPPEYSYGGNDSPRYFSHQERAFMQPSKKRGSGEFAPSARQFIAEDAAIRHAPHSEVIDLTSSPSRAPRITRLANDQFAHVRVLDAGPGQARPAHAEATRPIKDEYHGHRSVGAVSHQHEPTMVGNRQSLALFSGAEAAERHHHQPRSAVDRPHRVWDELDQFDGAGDVGKPSSISHHVNAIPAYSTPNHPFPVVASASRFTDEQVLERSFPTTRRSDEWVVERIEVPENRSTQRIGRGVATYGHPLDPPGPSQRPRVPVMAERLVGEPMMGRDPHVIASPTGTRISLAYDDLAMGDSLVRQQAGGASGHRSGPTSHYFDYRAPPSGTVRRHNDGAGAYR